MVEIPDSLRSVFSASVRERDGKYVIDIPSREFDHDALRVGETYRVAVFEAAAEEPAGRDDSQPSGRRGDGHRQPAEPPVEEGEVRDVTIETVGDQGDGIAKVERGYVVIVSDSKPGDEPTVEIEQVQENVAFGSVVERDSQAH